MLLQFEKAHVWWDAVGLVWPVLLGAGGGGGGVIKVHLAGELKVVPLHCSVYRIFYLQLIS